MVSLSNYKKITLLTVYIIVGLILAFISNTQQCTSYSTECTVIVFSYFITGGAWYYCIIRNNIYIFEPCVMVLGITIITYTVAPILSIYNDDLTINGFYVFKGCIKASILYVISFLLFLFFYYSKNNKKQHYTNLSFNFTAISSSKKRKKNITIVLYFFCLLSIGVCLIDLKEKGFSLNYILSLGVEGNFEKTEEDIGALINLRFLMITSFLYLDLISHNKKQKIFNMFLKFVAITCLFATSKRWLIIILIISPLVLNYVKKRKAPQGYSIIIVCILLFLITGIMQYMRYYSTTSVVNVDWSGLSFNELWKGISGNFDLYKTLYAAVVYFPDYHPHTLGQQLVYLTLITCIPRSIWPEKPISVFEELKYHFMGQGSIDGAWAYAQFTEYYIEYGVLGLFVLFSLFAKICKWLKKKTINPKNIHDLVLISFMYPMLMQLVIRGYMPINFWAIFFMLIPIFTIKYLTKDGSK